MNAKLKARIAMDVPPVDVYPECYPRAKFDSECRAWTQEHGKVKSLVKPVKCFLTN